uniref:Uncharacterized protein n=1 Tax=Cacopsylla melanoneura TaxID=428564 RepID=A0A8D9APG0_9HEMI
MKHLQYLSRKENQRKMKVEVTLVLQSVRPRITVLPAVHPKMLPLKMKSLQQRHPKHRQGGTVHSVRVHNSLTLLTLRSSELAGMMDLKQKNRAIKSKSMKLKTEAKESPSGKY